MGAISDNFLLEEFVHPAIFKTIGSRSADFLHHALVDTDQMLRESLGVPIIINNWHDGGVYESSGLRLPTGAVGSMLSSHKFGCATDKKFGGDMTTDEAFDHIMSNQSLYPNITRIENIEATRTSRGELGRDWLHTEVGLKRPAGADIYVYWP